MRALVDFHHTSLYSSLQMLFEKRLGFEMFRPIGLEWYEQGFWAVWPQRDTAEQFLSLDQGFRPADGTPALNQFHLSGWGVLPDGIYEITNPEYPEMPHRACTLEYFKNTQFDLLVASMPQHIAPFQKLIRDFWPQAKLIFQVGNNWTFDQPGLNVLASTAPRPVRDDVHACFYHQEFDLGAFYPREEFLPEPWSIHSYTNVLQGSALQKFLSLESKTPHMLWRSYGGQCRDGCVTGAAKLGDSMRSAALGYHVKPGGDGFGHTVHNLLATGTPVITHVSDYRGQLAEALLTHETCVNLDGITLAQAAWIISDLLDHPDRLERMSQACAQRFRELVNYDAEELRIREWMEGLL